MIRFLSIVTAAFCLVLLIAPAHAQDADKGDDIDWKKGAWGDLSLHIGTYHLEAVLNDARVTKALEELMGKDQAEKLKQSMEVQSPIGFEDDCLILSGSLGGGTGGYVAVCLYAGKVHAALDDGEMIRLYTKAEKYSYLPFTMKVWIYAQKNPEVTRAMPSGVDYILAE